MKARSQANSVIRKVKKEFEQQNSRNSKENQKTFYKYVNSKSKTHSGIPNLMKADGSRTLNNKEREDLTDLPFGTRQDIAALEDIDKNEQDVDEVLE